MPKTVDNDLPITDCCPGFGSVAKYVAVSIREAGFDVASMARTSTKVFVLEVMGRHAGWIAAAGGLAAQKAGDAPHIILFPEIAFDEAAFLARIEECVKKYGYCAVVVSEGVRNADGKFLADAGTRDAFGHAQLGGVGPVVAQLVKDKLGYKYHWAVADYLQRAARHIASKVDVEQAYAVGKAAVDLALQGPQLGDADDRPHLEPALPLEDRHGAASTRWPTSRRCCPATTSPPDGFGITAKGRKYLAPLIQGEDYPPYEGGLPEYVVLKNKAVKKKLKKAFVV